MLTSSLKSKKVKMGKFVANYVIIYTIYYKNFVINKISYFDRIIMLSRKLEIIIEEKRFLNVQIIRVL